MAIFVKKNCPFHFHLNLQFLMLILQNLYNPNEDIAALTLLRRGCVFFLEQCVCQCFCLKHRISFYNKLKTRYCGGTGMDSTVPTNTVPITTVTVKDSSSECTGFIG